ncbi:hypothetical protein A2631_03600 [Candidatus Daviesbacteria bacterium RIFCSPHIGHO2_01_FULL_44_29]|uniref:General secretion pathway GspH domain-containing protein n=1 Tax=Candidatus Daviesbacteria bacterium RIFCSPHIGHO2_02_FULL_43_12 TaxID=1797776 RepID=A0A1F5KFI9_9BACT|nr:MAG: hypothetical protein A2631_03600 [Candidatus Daviesbacteria bacterium RIFCSPHIGHO2_01_FULL_44_29]OGE38816.1 MAG: hypothetical protein A3E86_02785 [Candidatus Daviesbacteria bacterium RIFCSPHIGHO2_12_FULL_47_45]OGE39713.1 MAG: hypothetical protein A3D25_03225 [Candidatus Daviesbacteria bacterium RIFCSPHIGHO2_02_FULL_43_12]OGE69996.1 MAG: hypothetical protein A3B55_04865 [Candidatus Daviesbacteria bacterium RIFCSPLOWO2_01_FULL_43_15]
MNQSRGFTLIEILVTIGILAMLSLFIIPNFRRFNDEQILRNSSSDLLQAIRKAQINAQAHVRCPDNNPSFSWGVTIDPSEASYKLVAECQDPTVNYTTYDFSEAGTSLPSGVSINTITNLDKTPPMIEPSLFSPNCVIDASLLPFTIRFNTSENVATFTSGQTADSTLTQVICGSSASQSETLKFMLVSSGTNLTSTVMINRGGYIGVEYK